MPPPPIFSPTPTPQMIATKTRRQPHLSNTMFRTASKKAKQKKARIRRSSPGDEEDDETGPSMSIGGGTVADKDNNNDDDNEEDNIVRLALQKRRQERIKNKKIHNSTSSTTTRNLDDDGGILDESNTRETTRTRTSTLILGGGSRSSKKRRRIGYGGGAPPAVSSGVDDADQMNEKNEDEMTSLYDPEVLAQLKAEQAEMNSRAMANNEPAPPTAQRESATFSSERINDIINRTMPFLSSGQPPPSITPTAVYRSEETVQASSARASEKSQDEDFISLNSDRHDKPKHAKNIVLKQDSVLAGDEALEAAMNMENLVDLNQSGKPHDRHWPIGHSETHLNPLTTATAEENNMWQDQIAQRAGIGKSSLYSTSSEVDPIRRANQPNNHAQPRSNRQTLSLLELRQQFIDAQSALGRQMEDVETSLDRRQVDIRHTQDDELKQHTLAVESCGKALEFYQLWRAQAVPHVAALRELSDKLASVQQTLAKRLGRQIGLVKERRRLQIDDSLAVLHETKRLESIMGRQPVPSVFTVETERAEVDEFGRTIQSQRILQREKRIQLRASLHQQRSERQRQEKHLQTSKTLLDITEQRLEYWMTDSEIESFSNQKLALQEALLFALGQVQEEYTHLSKVTKLFSEWHNHDTHEYKDCFAGLSLADLASVLVRANLCSTLLLLDDQETSPEWMDTIQQARSEDLLDDDAILRLFEKSFIPFLVYLIRETGFDIEFSRPTRDLLQLWKDVTSLIGTTNVACGSSSPSSKWKEVVGKPLVNHVQCALEEIAFPVLKRQEDNSQSDEGKDSSYTNDQPVDMSVFGEQLLHVEQMVYTILEFEVFFQSVQCYNDLVEVVVNFLLNTVLPFLSSLNASNNNQDAHGVERTTTTTASPVALTFSKIWQMLARTEWLKRPEMLVQATTLQAAAELYQ